MNAVTKGLAPKLPPEQPNRPAVRPQTVLPKDEIPPARTLLESSDYVPEQKPIEISRYTSREFHDAEVVKMWSKVWQYACWVGDIPNPGDVYVYRNVGQSVIVVRQTDGSLKAFRNSCLHRGRELCSHDAQQKQALRCPYHSFTWSLEGDLAFIPAAWDFPQIERDRSKFKLPEVQVDAWNGFVFVNFDLDAPSLQQYLGKLIPQWKEWDWSNRYRAVTVEKRVNCNWKTCMDAFIETLHVYATHPEAASLTTDTGCQYDVWADEPHFSRFHSITGFASACLDPQPNEQEILDSFTSVYLPETFGTPEGDLGTGETARQAIRRLSVKVYKDRMGLDVADMPNAELIDGTEYLLFPNFLVWPSLANPLVYRFRPGETPDTAVWETFIFLPFQGERPQPGRTVKLGPDDPMHDIPELGYVGPILQQDCENLAYMQNGMKASGTGVLQTSTYQEQRLRHYHETLDGYLKR